ncbi:MAG: hypothetical protein R2684_17235 [Pyrinomonadaceae bacterium]
MLLKTRTFRAILIIAVLASLSTFDAVAQAKFATRLIVLNKNANSVSIIDPATGKTEQTIPVGEGPHEVAISDDGRTAYVANYGASVPGSSFSVIDIALGSEKRVDVSPLTRPHGLHLLGGKLYFSAESNRVIARLDPATLKVDWIMGTGQNVSHMVVGTADQRSFFTTNIGSDTVTAFSLAATPPAASSITQIPVGKQPEAIGISPDGAEVWVGLNNDNAIDVIATASKTVVKRIDLGARPYRVLFEPTGKRVYSTIFATSEIVEIDPVSKSVIRRLKVDGTPFGISFSKDGKTAYVSLNREKAYIVVDLEKLEVVARGETGDGPDGIAITSLEVLK